MTIERKARSAPPPGCPGMRIKTYIVMQRNNVAQVGEANRFILDVKLTKAAAEEIRAANPGSYIERRLATK